MRRINVAITLLLAAVVGGVGGCVNQQKEVLKYRAVLDGPNTTVPTTQPAAPTTPLTLQDALRMANRHNEQLAAAGEDYVLALIDETRAAETFLPSVSFAPSFTGQERFSVPSAGGSTGGFDFAKFLPQNYTDLPINTTLRTDIVKDLYAVSAAAKTSDQRKALLLDLQQSVLLQVAQTYYAILQSEQSVRTLQSSVAVQDARVQNIQHRLDQGMARRLDVLQSQADAASARVQLTDAQNDVAKGRATLAAILGVPTLDCPLDDRFNAPDLIDAPDLLLARARIHRQDLLAAAHAVNSSAEAVKSAWGEYAPSIGVNLNTFLYRESFPQDSWWTAIFTVNLPLFEEGSIHNDVRAAYARLRQNIDRARQTDHQVNQDVHSGYADFIASRQRIKDLETEARSAHDAYDAAAREFNAGTATNLDALTAQDTALSAQLRLDQERFNLKLTYLALLRATGTFDRGEIELIAKQTTPAPGSPEVTTPPATSPTGGT
jgi:outer membrane protein TolC